MNNHLHVTVPARQLYSEYIHFCKHTNCFFFVSYRILLMYMLLVIFPKLEELKNEHEWSCCSYECMHMNLV